MTIEFFKNAFQFDIWAALETETVTTALPRYIKILKGRAKAKFLILKENGNLAKRISSAYLMLKNCQLCERRCCVDRNKVKGYCQVGTKPIISSYFVHFGEEPFFVPSFTIFFMGCSFACQYCQNWSISQWAEPGHVFTEQQIAEIIEQNSGCRNVNFVGGEPTPHLPFILKAMTYVKANIPILWNSNFYMSDKAMDLLSGFVDVWLTDWKYGNNRCAERLSKVANYWTVIERNHNRAFKDSEMVIRHLVLPGHFECCTKPILEYIGANFGRNVIVNIMAQYRPEWKAKRYKEISKPVSKEYMEKVYRLAERLELNYIK
jgi:putative pyruvate formate lyase activating enzyme